MTREEAKELLRTTPIDIRSPREDLNISDYFEALKLAIEALQERPKGRWIWKRDKVGNGFHCVCSICGRIEKKEEPFCNCGASMVGADMMESEQHETVL